MLLEAIERALDDAPPAATAVAALEPWLPVDDGCEGGRGTRAAGRSAGVIEQGPGSAAATGERVDCPVSGVVFEVTDGRARSSGLAFCCAGCAAYHERNAAGVAARRAR